MRRDWLIQLRVHDADEPVGLDEYCRRCWKLVMRFAKDFGHVPEIRAAGRVGALEPAATATELAQRMRDGAEEGNPFDDESVRLRMSTGAVQIAIEAMDAVRLNLCHVAVEGGWPGYWWTQDADVTLRRGPRLKGSRGSALAEAWFRDSLDIFDPTWARLVSLENGVAESFFPTPVPGTGEPGLGWMTYLDEDEYPTTVATWRAEATAARSIEKRGLGACCQVDKPWDRDNFDSVKRAEDVVSQLMRSHALVPARSATTGHESSLADEEEEDDEPFGW